MAASGTALICCGYIGGGNYDAGYGIAVDTQGNAYVGGTTYSSESEGFPVKIGPDLTYNSLILQGDAFVARVCASGTSLDFCGYMGGARTDTCQGIAVDGEGSSYITGYTNSRQNHGFPVLIGPDLTHNGNPGDFDNDDYVAKISAGGVLLYCGYIGGTGLDEAYGIAVDAEGYAYVAGTTTSGENDGFPVLIGPGLTINNLAGNNAFVAKVASTGASLVYCGYIGGASYDSAAGIAVDGQGNALVVGTSYSGEADGFPVVAGPDSTYNGGDHDGFVAKVLVKGLYCDRYDLSASNG